MQEGKRRKTQRRTRLTLKRARNYKCIDEMCATHAHLTLRRDATDTQPDVPVRLVETEVGTADLFLGHDVCHCSATPDYCADAAVTARQLLARCRTMTSFTCCCTLSLVSVSGERSSLRRRSRRWRRNGVDEGDAAGVTDDQDWYAADVRTGGSVMVRSTFRMEPSTKSSAEENASRAEY
eukprot:1172756-Prorocentrum_minimum.AAC.1